MKKQGGQRGQKTLFQAWNHASAKVQQNSKSLFETWSNTNSKKTSANSETDRNIDNLMLIDDEDDENELLAVTRTAEENEKSTNDSDAGNVSFSAVNTSHNSYDVIPGFDCSAGSTWVYPTNYPIRDYQFNIVQKALFNNTLVTLPTGLGKTFIAAVVMYNFYRWYPQGKIAFMAPTKPLVAQQIDACYNIMGIPHKDTAEMTG